VADLRMELPSVVAVLAPADVCDRLVTPEGASLLRVAPGDPENSYMIHKLDGRPGIVGQRMPRGTGPFLSDGQILVIRRWIELGANND